MRQKRFAGRSCAPPSSLSIRKRVAAGRRPPIGIERMLRVHFLRNWFNLSDPGPPSDREAQPGRPPVSPVERKETKVWGDWAYQGKADVIAQHAQRQRQFGFTKVRYQDLAPLFPQRGRRH
jgi:hypothetical protein